MTSKSDYAAIADQARAMADMHTETDWGGVAINALLRPLLVGPVISIENKTALKTTTIGDD